MIIAVFAKQIPNADQPAALDRETRTLVRQAPFVLDDADTYSVEMGLQLIEQAGEGEVVLISMAPSDDLGGLRAALAMGAARAVLISDEALAGSDALGTAKVLAAAVRHVGADLVLTGSESTDGYAGTVPIQVAELLDLPAVSAATGVSLTDQVLSIKRQREDGFEEISCPLPAVVAVTAGVVEPRYPSFKGIMSAKTKPVEVLSANDLGLDASEIGAVGARQQVVELEVVPRRASGQIFTDAGDGHERILAMLKEWKVQ